MKKTGLDVKGGVYGGCGRSKEKTGFAIFDLGRSSGIEGISRCK